MITIALTLIAAWIGILFFIAYFKEILLIGTLALIALAICSAARASDMSKVDMKGRPIRRIEALNLKGGRVMVLEKYIDDKKMKNLEKQLQDFGAKPKLPVYLIIDSNGGQVDAGFHFIQKMKGAKRALGLRTICIVNGGAYSMAAIISQYCHETYMTDFSDLLFHDVSYSVEGPHPDIKQEVSYLDRYIEQLETRLAKQMGISYAEYQRLKGRVLQVTAEDAVKYGFADAIVEDLYYEAEAPKEDNVFTIFFESLLHGIPDYIAPKEKK